LAAGKGTT